MKQIVISNQITPRSTDTLNRYLKEINRLSVIDKTPLTLQKESDLAIRIKNGDKDAEKILVTRNLRFVISVAKQYSVDPILFNDIINEGNYGLIKAAQKFDGSRGVKFISYAVWWIQQSILCYINETSRTIRLPLNKVSQLAKIKRKSNALEQKFGRTPTADEILDSLELELSQKEYENMLLIDKGTSSLDMDISHHNNSSESFTLEDVLYFDNYERTDAALEKQDLKFEVNRLLTCISEKGRIVISHYYGLNGNAPLTLDEIGDMIGLTRERVRQIKHASLLKMLRVCSVKKIKSRF